MYVLHPSASFSSFPTTLDKNFLHETFKKHFGDNVREKEFFTITKICKNVLLCFNYPTTFSSHKKFSKFQRSVKAHA